jgi:hypothetical protein
MSANSVAPTGGPAKAKTAGVTANSAATTGCPAVTARPDVLQSEAQLDVQREQQSRGRQQLQHGRMSSGCSENNGTGRQRDSGTARQFQHGWTPTVCLRRRRQRRDSRTGLHYTAQLRLTPEGLSPAAVAVGSSTARHSNSARQHRDGSSGRPRQHAREPASASRVRGPVQQKRSKRSRRTR